MMRHETVSSHLVAPAVRAAAGETIARVLSRLAEEKPERVELICVTDASGRLVGALPVSRAFSADGAALLDRLVDPDYPRVRPDDDQETAASVALHKGVESLPVVDRDGKLLGIMGSRAIMQVLRREHVEDLHVLAGIRREEAQARHAIEDPPSRRARHRLPWLLVGLAGGAVATATMAGFHATLEKTVAAAFFVPGLVYLADAVGTQSEAIAVRGLSLTRGGIAHLLAGELRTGMLMGAILGLIAYLPILAAFGDARLAGAVSFSLFVASSIACAIGLGLPWLFARRGWDPAYGSGPVATVIQDILTILLYFSVVRAFGV